MGANEAAVGVHSTSERVKRSLIMVLIGRSLSAMAGLLVLVLLSRLMEKDQYGQYFALWAIIEILILTSDPGIIHLIYRYVSATEISNKTILPNGPVKIFLCLRMLFLIVASIILFLLPQHLFEYLNIGQVTPYLKFVCLILIFEGGARAAEAVFDSMLCQNASQLSTILRTIIRLGGLAWVMFFDMAMKLELLLIVEVFGTLIGFAVAFMILVKIYHRAEKYQGNSEASMPIPLRTMLYYAAPAYLSQLLGILFGIDLLKLILSRFQSNQELALFGFVFSFTLVIQRYMPASLFGGIFRPVFVAASKKDQPEKKLVQLLVASLKINWLFIAVILSFGFVLADLIFHQVSNGNFQNAGPVFLISLLGLFGLSAHQLLTYLCIAKKNPWPPLIANIITSFGVTLSIFLTATFGAEGAAMSFSLSEFIWCSACLFLVFRGEQFIKHADINGIIRLFVTTVVLIGIGWSFLSLLRLNAWVVAALMILPILVAFCRGGIFSVQEGQWIESTIPAGNKLNRFVKFRQTLPSS